MFHANDNLSRAASAIWRERTAHDPMDAWAIGQCEELGPLIAAGERRREVEALAECGFTPGQFNDEIRRRMVTEGEPVSLTVRDLLQLLYVDACPECGGPIESESHPTRNYGGGWDTYVHCPDCGYQEVYV